MARFFSNSLNRMMKEIQTIKLNQKENKMRLVYVLNNNCRNSSHAWFISRHFTLGCLLSLTCILYSCQPGNSPSPQDASVVAKTTAIKDKVIMAVFAHADDEYTVAPVLARYAREGARVYLVTATDGRYGTGQTNLEPGEELVALRKEELNCAALNMGIEKPIWLGYHDQLKLRDGFFGHVPYVQQMMRDIDSLVNQLQPDVILTWGPDGESNHMDHRLVGASVSQVYLSKIWDKTKALYYVATPSSHIKDADYRMLSGVDDSYLTVQISFTREDQEKAVKAFECYKTQYSKETMEKVARKASEEKRTIYFRPLVRSASISQDLFIIP
ncbi:MAG TPA: PIG-L family deacetylase [Agriterribacter sp.]|nr:PIG-L family deacetylase [Agriterribacter sp.]